MRPFTHIAIGEQSFRREKRDINAFKNLKKITVSFNCSSCGEEILQSEARLLSHKINIDSRECKSCFEKSKKEIIEAQIALHKRKLEMKKKK